MTQQIDFVDLYDFLLKNAVAEPVTVVREGNPIAVLLPPELYEAMKGKKKALQAHELTADDMQAIMDSEIPEELKQYNHETEDTL
jgi:PHD/YefM family antitoxin component YafN of YafNO toxin-antitoxin module